MYQALDLWLLCRVAKKKKNYKRTITDLQKWASGMMYFTGKPSMLERTEALTCAFGSFPGTSQGQALPDISILFLLVCTWEMNLSLSCGTDAFPSIFHFFHMSLLRNWLEHDIVIFQPEHLYFCYSRCVPWSSSDLNATQSQDRYMTILPD